MGSGETVTAAHDVSNFPITESTLVTWTYTHNSKSIVQTQTVTIEDTEAPEVTALDAINTACSLAEGDITFPTAMDNCSGEITAATTASFPITKSGTVTWTYEDTARNIVTQTQEVVVSDDVLIPNVTSLPPINEQCEVASLNAPTARNCSGNTLTAAPDVTPPIMASTTITWTYTEGSNTATQTQEVNIADTEAPTVTGTLNTITSACSLAEADVNVPTANNACDGEIMGTHNVPTFPITSNTTITWTYRDKSGNEATQTQVVTITDCSEENEPLSTGDDAVEAVVFPNPSSGRYVEVQSPVESPIRILSVGGELVLESTTNTKMDAASLRSGLYLIQLPGGRLLKFIKR